MKQSASAILIVGGSALTVGAISTVSPWLGIVGWLLATAAMVVIVFSSKLPSIFLAAHLGLLLGYMFLGRGFAYVGVPPLYVGEAALALALVVIVLLLPRSRLSALHVLMIGFMIVGVMRTIPFVGRYGLDAARDAVIWGYAAFAIAVSLAVRERHFAWMMQAYRRIAPLYLCWIPVTIFLVFFSPAIIPRTPSGVPILHLKAGDVGVHLGAIAGFFLLGYWTERPSPFRIPQTVLWLLWIAGVATRNRAGLLAALVGLLAAGLLQRGHGIPRRWLPLGIVVSTLVYAAVLFNPVLQFGNMTLSVEKFSSAITSVFEKSESSRYENTKQWRLKWWGEIIDYTAGGPYFWTGKGFGINLADDDGFQVTSDDSLRSPHNGHMTILARMGVPGFVLWVAIQWGFGFGLWRALRRARQRQDWFWAQIDGLLLIYWLALLVNTSFDVYLEAPQGGIWFWSILGLGLAALRLQQAPRDAVETQRLVIGHVHAHPARS